jgi:hypothetical protein
MLSFLNIRVGLGALCFLVPSGSTNVASSISFLAWNLGLTPLISSLLRSRLEISPSIAIAILITLQSSVSDWATVESELA